MNTQDRDYTKRMEITDFMELDTPSVVCNWQPLDPIEPTRILRMLLRPKYGQWHIPQSLIRLRSIITAMGEYDGSLTGIYSSWCYLTIRSGLVDDTGDTWHFDGASFRTDVIPERNYIWSDTFGCQYKTGSTIFPLHFDPRRYNLFKYFDIALRNESIQTVPEMCWNMLSPMCFHRRDPACAGLNRTFIRISFTDIEIRDKNNTPNPLLPTPAYGRDPVVTYREPMIDYYKEAIAKANTGIPI